MCGFIKEKIRKIYSLIKYTPIIEPKIGYWWTKHCWCDLQQIKTQEDLEDCLEELDGGLVEGIFVDLKDAEYHLDLNGGDKESKKRFFKNN